MPKPKFISARDEISSEFVEEVCQRLQNGKPVHRVLPENGRLHLDRPLPFLAFHRLKENDVGSADLLRGQSCFLLAPSAPEYAPGVALLIDRITQTLADRFSAVLLLELWTKNAPEPFESGDLPPAVFRVVSSWQDEKPPIAARTLQSALSNISWPPFLVEAATIEGAPAAPDFLPVLSEDAAAQRSGMMLGLEIPPLFREAPNGPIYPSALRVLGRELSLALQHTFFEWMQVQAKQHNIEDFRALGRRSVGRSAWEADKQLAAIASEWNFLLLVTPVNAQSAWQQFLDDNCQKTPIFHDRLLPFDPDLIKRKLWAIPLEKVEAPALQHLFRDKRNELDRQITMLEDRETPRFLPGSLALYGGIEASLREIAHQILEKTVPPAGRESEKAPPIDAPTFAKRAEAEIEKYRQIYPEIASVVEIRHDVPGVMVANGNLLIGENFRTGPERIEALLQHEVGTHIVTFANGRAQRLQLLSIGLPGYDALQEGTALLAEYLAGGLRATRLRLLAARVVAVDSLVQGADFIETFRLLHGQHGFKKRVSWNLAMRVYRGGGFTKDAVYLRGFVRMLRFLGEGGKVDLLWSGKISGEALPLIEELFLRGVLRPAPLRPAFLDSTSGQAKLAKLRADITVLDLLQELEP